MAELVSKDRPELLDGERLGERQGDEQIVAEPPEQPKARRLHHGGVDLVGNQDVVEVRRAQRRAQISGKQLGRISWGYLAAFPQCAPNPKRFEHQP